MGKILLGDICKPKQWKTISTSMLEENGYPVYGANGIIGKYSKYNHEKETLLITCRGATCGQLNISVPFSYINGNAMALDDLDESVDIKYLYYFLKGRGFKDIISGSAQPQIIRSSLEKIQIDFKELKEQKVIVDQFTIIETLINLKRRQLTQLNNLIKARFVEMFGDPELNSMNWRIKTIGEVSTDVRYGTSKPASVNGQYPYLRMNNLTMDGTLDLSDLKYIDVSKDEVEKCVVKKGDILFNRTNSLDLIGKTAMFNLDENMIIAGYIIRVRLNEELLPEVLAQYMNLEPIKRRLKSMAKGAVNQANINAQELKSIKVYIPEMILQRKFVDIKNKINKSKVAVQKSLDETQLLFDSLMQKYFG